MKQHHFVFRILEKTKNRVLLLPSLWVPDTHPELSGATLHRPSDHQAVAGLEHVQRARHGREAHGADENRYLIVITRPWNERRKCYESANIFKRDIYIT